MSQLGKVVLMPNWQLMHGRRDIDMNLYLLSHKAETGLDSDTLPQQPRECTPVEIPSWVEEAGSGDDWRQSSPCLFRGPCNSGADWTSSRLSRVGSWPVSTAVIESGEL